MTQPRLADYLGHMRQAWRSMRGMRNRIAHGYFDINLDVVWETVVTALPALSAQLDRLLAELASDVPSADESKKP